MLCRVRHRSPLVVLPLLSLLLVACGGGDGDGADDVGGTGGTADVAGSPLDDATSAPEPDTPWHPPPADAGPDGPEDAEVPTIDVPPGDDFDPVAFGPLCDPCFDSGPCAADDAVTACVTYGGDGWFCASHCVDDGDCPEGYVCEGVATAEGDATGSWCVRTPDGTGGFAECPCSDEAVTSGAKTTCSSGADGSGCQGTRRCTLEGLSPCDFTGESAEVCNGEDDDCDGETDESTCSDGDPCTADSCDGATGECVTAPTAEGGACDDGDECTLEDTCQDGVCVPGPPRDCDDHSPCTEPGCDSVLGACVYTPVPGSCEDGDECTGPDLCQDGECLSEPILDCLYLAIPDLAACDPGALKPGVGAQALAEVNAVRALSGLAPVPWDEGSAAAVQAGALMIAANAELSHTPPPSWTCYTATGAQSLGVSNLYQRWWKIAHQRTPPAEVIDVLLIDDGIETLGHRRWLLDPFLPRLSYGSVDGPPVADIEFDWIQASVVRVIYEDAADPGLTPPAVVAYPMGDYPASLFDLDWYLSVSIVHDTSARSANSNVSYAGTTITVSGPDGQGLPILSPIHSDQAFGVPNHLQWKVEGLAVGVQYGVTLSGVLIGGVGQPDFTYGFRLVE